MVASLRKSDSIAEQALGVFLDEHFYETLHRRDAGFEYERVHDRKRQLKGMDVIVNYHGNRIVIDENQHCIGLTVILGRFRSSCHHCKVGIVIQCRDGSTMPMRRRTDIC